MNEEKKVSVMRKINQRVIVIVDLTKKKFMDMEINA